MKFKEIKTNEGQQELFKALIRWGVYQNTFTSLSDLLSSSETVDFIKDYIEDVSDVITKEIAALKLQQFFIAKSNNVLLQDNFNIAVYEKDSDLETFSKTLPELNTTDKNQPDEINKLMCDNFSEIKATDVFLFPCAGRGSDALYVYNTYNVPKDNCFFIEINRRLCKRLKSLGFKNVICGDIMSNITWTKLYNILKEKSMIINKVLMNPPYDGNLHLKVLETTLKAVGQNNPDCEIVSIQPARWLEDSTAPYKSGSDYKTYKDSIFSRIYKLQLVDATTACKAFNIMNATDLGIYTFKLTPNVSVINKQQDLVNKLLAKILKMPVLKNYIETKAVSGFRCEVKELTSGTGGHNLGNAESSKIADVNIVWGPYTNGYTQDGKFFTEARQKNQFTKSYFANSISFETLEQANNFFLSCNTKFYRRLTQLLKWDVHVPLRFLPYMEDYSKVWTDEDYCKFFNLTEEESEFMCRTVDDYRIKDFINYITLED